MNMFMFLPPSFLEVAREYGVKITSSNVITLLRNLEKLKNNVIEQSNLAIESDKPDLDLEEIENYINKINSYIANYIKYGREINARTKFYDIIEYVHNMDDFQKEKAESYSKELGKEIYHNIMQAHKDVTSNKTKRTAREMVRGTALKDRLKNIH